MNPSMTPRWYRIRRRIRETADTYSLELAAVASNPDSKFAPGQFNMLYLFATGEVPISISGNPRNSAVVVHTIRAYGAVTNGMRRLVKGDTVGLRGPYGTGWPLDEMNGRDILLCAGGIGMAPLRPVIYSILERREAFGRVVLLYGERSPADLIYRRDMERWRRCPGLEVRVTVDSAMRSRSRMVWVTPFFIGCRPLMMAERVGEQVGLTRKRVSRVLVS